MQIIMKTIRIIDYEKKEVYKRETPDSFSEYIEQLISHINANKSVREYKTRSVNTEVINCVLDIVQKHMDEENINLKIDSIAQRLLLKEIEAQEKIGRLSINIQKGSLIQALLYDEEEEKHIYLLAKVEHSDFVDDYDFTFKSGFSKDKKTLWKSCLFNINDGSAQEFQASVYSNTVAKYWWDGFLELEELKSDELNTTVAFKRLESTLSRNIKKIAPKDHTIIRNAVIAYFKSNEHIDYDNMIKTTLEDYVPVELTTEKMQDLISKARELPTKYEFDRQFTSVPNSINARIRRVYDVYQGVQIRITDAIDNLEDTIQAYRADDGNRYIRIKTNNDETYRSFLK